MEGGGGNRRYRTSLVLQGEKVEKRHEEKGVVGGPKGSPNLSSIIHNTAGNISYNRAPKPTHALD